MQVCTWCRSDVVQGGYGAGECGVVQWCSVVQGESGRWQVDGMVQNEVQGVVRGKCGAVWCRSRVVRDHWGPHPAVLGSKTRHE